MQTKASVIQVVGYRNSGKTTLICRLVSKLTEEGLRVGTVKHDAHRFEIDYPGKDTWKHRMAGAETVAITSREQTAVMRRRYTPLDELLREMGDLDVVLVEGFKFANYPKIVLVRTYDQLSLIEKTDNMLAVVSWFPLPEADVSVFHKDDFTGIYTRLFNFVTTGSVTRVTIGRDRKMSFTLTKKAADWFKREFQLNAGDYVRFYVRYGGMNGPGNGFSLGVSVTPPVNIGEKTVVDDITFYVEQDDLWICKEAPLTIRHNEKTDEIEFIYD